MQRYVSIMYEENLDKIAHVGLNTFSTCINTND